MALPCSEKIAALPIDDRYKEAIKAFCSDPKNESACQLLCDTPPDVLAEKFDQVEGQLTDWVENGVPEELGAAVAQKDPQLAQAADQFLKNEAPKILEQERGKRQQVQSFAKGGLATLGRFGDNDMVHAQKGEMVVPNHVLNEGGLREHLSNKMSEMGANPSRYTVGGSRASYNPYTGRQEFFSLGGVVGAIAGAALAVSTGGASLAIGAGLGAAAGTYLDTGDLGEAALMGVGAFGLAGAGVAGGLWGAGQAGYGAGLTSSAWLGGAGSNILGAAPVAGATGSTATSISGAVGGTAGGVGGTVGGTAGGSFSPVAGSIGGTGATSTGELLSSMGFEGMSTASPIELVSAGAPYSPIGAGSTVGAAGAGGAGASGSWFGDLATSAKDWWDKSSWLDKAGAASLGMTALSATGALTPDMPERPAGYDLQTDPSAQYGGKAYETLGPEDLFGNIDEMGSGVPGSPGNPIGVGGAINYTPSGYSYGSTAQEMMQPEDVTYGAPAYRPSYTPYSVPDYSQYYAANGGHIRGAGTSTSDSIPARLSDGEFVLTTKAVRGAGNGNLREGAKRLYALMDSLERNA